LQILPRDDPGTFFAELNLDSPLGHYGQFDSCTPQQTDDIKRAIEDVHKLATLGSYAPKVNLVGDAANIMLFGAAVTLSSEVAELLISRWFGVKDELHADHPGGLNKTRAIGGSLF
jgi:hypothetical protein